MSNPANVRLIAQFYGAFSNGDAQSMAACYHPDAVFLDPVFGELRGAEIGDMWRMLLARSKGDLVINFKNVGADAHQGHADWTTGYVFSATGRKVHNVIHAEFQFKDGLIALHRDDFSFWKWARMALGITGWLLGWTPALRKKVSKNARKALENFRKIKN